LLESPDVIRADFDLLAPFSTDGWDHNRHYHAFLLRQLPPHCAAALEIGCGTGGFARLLAGRADHVFALDLSPEMIRVARERSHDYANIEYRVADVMACDLPLASFDCAVSIATLHHLPLESVLTTLRGALKPGGVLALLDLFESAGPRDRALAALAVPVSGALNLLKTGRLRPSQETRAAWAAHGRHDIYMTLDEVRRVCAAVLPGARVRHHLLWRYSLVWRKSGHL
jgi:SAM-dependent methyltransferase